MEFEYSLANRNKRIKKRQQILQLFIPLCLLGFIFLSPFSHETDLQSKIRSWLLLSIWLELIMLAPSFLISRMMVYAKIELQDTAIERKNGQKLERMRYQEIESIQCHHRYKSDEVILIQLISSKKTWPIYNYENMSVLFEKIIERVPDQSIVEIKTPRIDWLHPFVQLTMGVVIVLAVIGIQTFGELPFKLFSAAFVLLMGLYLLIFKPLSKTVGIKFRGLEIAVGIIWVGGASILLARSVLSWFIL